MADLGLFDSRTMLDVLDMTPQPKTFLRDMFFPGVKFHETKKVDIDVVKGKRRMAPFVNPELPGTTMAREGFRTDTFEPPYIKPFRTITPGMLLDRQPGETIYKKEKSHAERLAEMIGKDLGDMRKYIVRREEWMVRCALLDAKVRVIGEGVDATIDFLRDPSHTFALTLGDKWTADTSDPLGNIRDWKLLIAQDSGLVPNVAVVGSDVAKAIMKNPVLLEALDNRRVTLGQINPQDLPNGASFLGDLENVSFYTYAEWFIDDEDEEQPMIPANKMLMGSINAECTRHYGVIQDLDAMGEAFSAAVDYFPSIFETKNPSRKHVMLQSAPIPVPHEVDAFATITPI